MKFWTIVIFFISLFLSFIMGYYFGLTPEIQKQTLGDWKNVILFFTPIGVLIGIWLIVMEWYSESSLKFGEITFDNGIYFIDVIKNEVNLRHKIVRVGFYLNVLHFQQFGH
jgi:hypothetical protein